jgi:hypothetical protein
MRTRDWFCGLMTILVLVPAVQAAAPTEKLRNDKVLVVEQTLAPGATAVLPTNSPAVLVYLDDGSIATTVDGTSRTNIVKRGESVFRLPPSGAVKNAGGGNLRIVSVEFLGKGGQETWGNAGLSPNYRVLFENQYSRVYDIRVAAGRSEPMHTHHDRVIVCLSGAKLEHELPDGQRETSSVKTGEIAWRRAATHIGHNLGMSDLWVIAIEPK